MQHNQANIKKTEQSTICLSDINKRKAKTIIVQKAQSEKVTARMKS